MIYGSRAVEVRKVGKNEPLSANEVEINKGVQNPINRANRLLFTACFCTKTQINLGAQLTKCAADVF